MKFAFATLALMSTFASPFVARAQTAPQQASDAKTTMSALYELGVRNEGTRVAAMSGLSLDENGKFKEEIAVFFSRMVGATQLIARDVTVFESAQKSYLVMTYQMEPTRSELVTKTEIIEVNSDAARTIAAFVKANASPVDNSSSQSLKILAYTLKAISCSQVVYPGAQPSCSVTK